MKLDKYIVFEAYRLGILLNLLKPEDLIEQIDRLIVEKDTEEIPHVFYVLSLARDRKRMLELLTDLTQGINEEMPACIIAGLLYQEREKRPREELFELAGLLKQLVKDPADEIIVELDGLKEQHDRMQEAYGLRFRRKKARDRLFQKTENRLIELLKTHEKYAEQFRSYDWSEPE
ncbi:hypothetical protein [Indiicoccus explosivorum]|uniref:hypothetical protein n=1 Tax=Indiicoccus explosivorum TaxID=1917864 RepID=UPI000B43A419|nr:hypothetical protein [Indiicoccus explosivorum]